MTGASFIGSGALSTSSMLISMVASDYTQLCREVSCAPRDQGNDDKVAREAGARASIRVCGASVVLQG
jgi:hypothetical protein